MCQFFEGYTPLWLSSEVRAFDFDESEGVYNTRYEGTAALLFVNETLCTHSRSSLSLPQRRCAAGLSLLVLLSFYDGQSLAARHSELIVGRFFFANYLV